MYVRQNVRDLAIGQIEVNSSDGPASTRRLS